MHQWSISRGGHWLLSFSSQVYDFPNENSLQCSTNLPSTELMIKMLSSMAWCMELWKAEVLRRVGNFPEWWKFQLQIWIVPWDSWQCNSLLQILQQPTSVIPHWWYRLFKHQFPSLTEEAFALTHWTLPLSHRGIEQAAAGGGNIRPAWLQRSHCEMVNGFQSEKNWLKVSSLQAISARPDHILHSNSGHF